MEKLHDGELNRALWYGCPERRFFIFGQEQYISGVLTGDFLLDDLKTISVAPVYGHEKAIAVVTGIGEYYYQREVSWLMYHLMSPLNMSYDEAERISRQNGYELPGINVLQKAADSLTIINHSLKLVTGGEKQIAEDVLNEYWYKGCSPHDRRYQKRKLLLFDNHLGYCTAGESIGSADSCWHSGFALVHRNYNEMYWVLQQVGKWYYALEDRMCCNLYRSQDCTCNGYLRIGEDGTLILANPHGATFEDEGREYINVYENFYQKDEFGIYRRHGYRLINEYVPRISDYDE